MSRLGKSISVRLHESRLRLLENWNARDVVSKFYLTGKLFSLLPVLVFVVVSRDVELFAAFALPSMALFCAGFMKWAIPIVLRIFASARSRWLWIIPQTLLFPFCISLARGAVASSTGLPPQFFDLTVALISILFVPLAWIFLVAGISLAGAVFGTFSWSLGRTFARFSEYFKTIYSLSSAPLVPSKKTGGQVSDHLIGYFVTLILLLGLSSVYEEHVRRPDIIRLLVYVLDFNRVTIYPGLKHDVPLRLIDNGKVAYATRTGWNVNIVVEELPSTHANVVAQQANDEVL